MTSIEMTIQQDCCVLLDLFTQSRPSKSAILRALITFNAFDRIPRCWLIILLSVTQPSTSWSTVKHPLMCTSKGTSINRQRENKHKVYFSVWVFEKKYRCIYELYFNYCDILEHEYNTDKIYLK